MDNYEIKEYLRENLKLEINEFGHGASRYFEIGLRFKDEYFDFTSAEVYIPEWKIYMKNQNES